jgi:RNA polymerase sigma-70 factor (ECF subfamily)
MDAGEEAILDAVRNLQDGVEVEKNFERIYAHYHPQVFRYFRRKGIPDETCCDLAQNVWVSVFRGASQIRDAAAFKGWLFQIARNAFFAMLSQKRPESSELLRGEEESLLEETVRSNTKDALETLLDQEKIVQLRHTIDELPDQMRRCVAAYYVHGQPYGEIASAMGISINTVKAHLHKARARLEGKLQGTTIGN